MSERDREPISLGEVLCLRATGKAILVAVNQKQIWIPRSVIDFGGDWAEGDVDELFVAAWFAEKEGLE